jgi:hypothetical protein
MELVGGSESCHARLTNCQPVNDSLAVGRGYGAAELLVVYVEVGGVSLASTYAPFYPSSVFSFYLRAHSADAAPW